MGLIVRVDFKKLLCLSAAFLLIAPFNDCVAGDDPKSQPLVPVETVGTLRPSFAWSTRESESSYDLIICAGVHDRHGFWVPGKTVYYREGLTTTTHTIDRPLLPDTVYVWSVRARSGKKTSKWVAYGDDDPVFIKKNKARYNAMCAFKTPAH